jgi:hypothetical protein
MVVAKNMRQVVSQVVETLADAPKQEECKLNLRLTGFEATGPNEAVHQGRCCHAAMACDSAGLQFDDKRTPRRGAAQIYNERRPSGCAARAQRPSRDQVGPG